MRDAARTGQQADALVVDQSVCKRSSLPFDNNSDLEDNNMIQYNAETFSLAAFINWAKRKQPASDQRRQPPRHYP